MKTKTFDCVEMKNRIQAKRVAEYEGKRHRYASFFEFVAAHAEESPWCRRQLARFGRQRPTDNAQRSTRKQ